VAATAVRDGGSATRRETLLLQGSSGQPNGAAGAEDRTAPLAFGSNWNLLTITGRGRDNLPNPITTQDQSLHADKLSDDRRSDRFVQLQVDPEGTWEPVSETRRFLFV
jgi:hypothetical protein